MKPIKMFGLAALAALMAMAFVGVSSAMAESTLLCTADESPCSQANAVSSVHEVSVGKATLLSSAINVECEVLFSGTAESVREISAEVVTGNFTYSSCNSGCVVTEESPPATIEVLKEGHETGKVTGEGLVHVKCSGFIDCSYNGVGLVGTAKGPLLSTQKNGEVSLSGQTTNKETGGFLCPKTAKLDIVTSPLSATYIAAAQVYCVEYTHNTHGLYEGMFCETGTANRTHPYALVRAGGGHVAGEHLCVLLPVNAGLYENRTTSLLCANDVVGNGRPYELGTIL